MMVSGFPHNLCITGHVPIYGAALCAPAATHVLSCSSQEKCMGECITFYTIGLLCLPLSARHQVAMHISVS